MAQLLGPDGRPIKKQELVREHARPSIAGIRQPWAESIALGLTPETLAAVLRGAAQGDGADYVALAEEMEEKDAHYASVLGTRKRAVSGIAPVVHPGGDDAQSEKIADAVRARITNADGWSGLVEDLMDAVGKGWAAVEIHWTRSASEWRPERFTWSDPRWFRWDRDTGRELRLLTDAEPAWGEGLAPAKWIVHAARSKSGLPLRGGLARLVAFGWLCKAYAIKDWVAFAEIYGLPLRLGRYGPEATKDDVRILHHAVASIGHDAAAVLPEAMRIEFQDLAAKSDGGELFEKLARWVDEQTSKAVLGQTMTTDSGGSLAQAKVHEGVRHDIQVADARAIAATINRHLVRPFVDLNFVGKVDVYPRVELPVAEPEDLKEIMDAIASAASIGVRMRSDDIRAKLGLAAPDPDDKPEDVIGGAPAAPPVTAPPVTAPPVTGMNRQRPTPAHPAPCGCDTALNRAGDPFDPYAGLDDIELEAALEWEPQMAPLIDPIRALVAEAGSLEEIRDRLPELIDGAQIGPLVEGLVAAMFRARALGDLDGPEAGA